MSTVFEVQPLTPTQSAGAASFSWNHAQPVNPSEATVFFSTEVLETMDALNSCLHRVNVQPRRNRLENLVLLLNRGHDDILERATLIGVKLNVLFTESGMQCVALYSDSTFLYSGSTPLDDFDAFVVVGEDAPNVISAEDNPHPAVALQLATTIDFMLESAAIDLESQLHLEYHQQ